jgi:glycerol-3-phosphate dehydrogenase subunit C
MTEKKEGSLSAPTRDIVDWKSPEYLNEEALDAEMRRQFEVCHSCRRCFNLCESFPTLFDLIDESKDETLESVDSKDFPTVVDKCTLCDMCFMTKCPYVPPHEFNIDFPHLMLRYRTLQKSKGQLNKVPQELAKIDRNARIAGIAPSLANWGSNKKNRFTRKSLQTFTGIDQSAELPSFEKKTYIQKSKETLKDINKYAPAFGRRVAIYSTCYVNYNNTSVGIAAEKVLLHNGVEVKPVYPGCCGMPYLEQSQHEKVTKQSELVSNELCKLIDEGYDIVTLTASCGLMLKFEWPLLNSKNEKIKKLSKHTYDIDQYIADISKKEGLMFGLNQIKGGITVHNACHARAQNMGNKALEMLKNLPDTKVDVVERCAGHGGTFGVMKETRKAAVKYGRTTARQIKNKKTKYVVSDCPLASKHLDGILNENAEEETVSMHPIEILSKSYNL